MSGSKGVPLCFLLVICLVFVFEKYHCILYSLKRENELDNTICQNSDLIFNEGPLTSVQCVGLCISMASNCIGVWYSTNVSRQCYGCSKMENSNRTPLYNTMAYRRIDCMNYMVANVNDSQLSSSSYYGAPNEAYGAKFARLHTVELIPGRGAWSAGAGDPFIQVDFLELRRVTGVATQGRDSDRWPQWVTEYQVMTSTDCIVFDYVLDASSQIKVFPGNTDSHTIVVNEFGSLTFARCVRINPTQFYRHTSLRFDVVGCQF